MAVLSSAIPPDFPLHSYFGNKVVLTFISSCRVAIDTCASVNGLRLLQQNSGDTKVVSDLA